MANMRKKSFIKNAILRTLSNKRMASSDFIRKNVIDSNKDLDCLDAKTNYAINRSIKTLLSKGLIESFDSDNEQYFRLTNDGNCELNNLRLENDFSLISTKWDGFWRIIILDLSENRKNEREALRYLLKKAGFVCVKNSVWISMYPFEHLFTNIKNDLHLSSEMMIVVTDKIDEETEKEFFKSCGYKI